MKPSLEVGTTGEWKCQCQFQQVWVAGLRADLFVTCGDSDLEEIGTRPCLAISESAQIQAQKVKWAKSIVVIYLRARSG